MEKHDFSRIYVSLHGQFPEENFGNTWNQLNDSHHPSEEEFLDFYQKVQSDEKLRHLSDELSQTWAVYRFGKFEHAIPFKLGHGNDTLYQVRLSQAQELAQKGKYDQAIALVETFLHPQDDRYPSLLETMAPWYRASEKKKFPEWVLKDQDNEFNYLMHRVSSQKETLQEHHDKSFALVRWLSNSVLSLATDFEDIIKDEHAALLKQDQIERFVNSEDAFRRYEILKSLEHRVNFLDDKLAEYFHQSELGAGRGETGATVVALNAGIAFCVLGGWGLVAGSLTPWVSAGSTGTAGASILGQSVLGQSALGQSALGQSALGQSALGQSALGQSARSLLWNQIRTGNIKRLFAFALGASTLAHGSFLAWTSFFADPEPEKINDFDSYQDKLIKYQSIVELKIKQDELEEDTKNLPDSTNYEKVNSEDKSFVMTWDEISKQAEVLIEKSKKTGSLDGFSDLFFEEGVRSLVDQGEEITHEEYLSMKSRHEKEQSDIDKILTLSKDPFEQTQLLMSYLDPSLEYYARGRALICDYYRDGKGNCEYRAKRIIGNLSKIKYPPHIKLRAHLFDDHIEALLENLNPNHAENEWTVYHPRLSKGFGKEYVRGALMDPALFYRALLVGHGKSPQVSVAELYLWGGPDVKIGKERLALFDFGYGNSTLHFPSVGVNYSDSAPPEEAYDRRPNRKLNPNQQKSLVKYTQAVAPEDQISIQILKENNIGMDLPIMAQAFSLKQIAGRDFSENEIKIVQEMGLIYKDHQIVFAQEDIAQSYNDVKLLSEREEIILQVLKANNDKIRPKLNSLVTVFEATLQGQSLGEEELNDHTGIENIVELLNYFSFVLASRQLLITREKDLLGQIEEDIPAIKQIAAFNTRILHLVEKNPAQVLYMSSRMPYKQQISFYKGFSTTSLSIEPWLTKELSEINSKEEDAKQNYWGPKLLAKLTETEQLEIVSYLQGTHDGKKQLVQPVEVPLGKPEHQLTLPEDFIGYNPGKADKIQIGLPTFIFLLDESQKWNRAEAQSVRSQLIIRATLEWSEEWSNGLSENLGFFHFYRSVFVEILNKMDLGVKLPDYSVLDLNPDRKKKLNELYEQLMSSARCPSHLKELFKVDLDFINKS